VEGWAHDADNPAAPVLLEISVDGAVAVVLLADQFRADLRTMNGGQCAFFCALPPRWRIGAASRLVVRRARDGRELARTPRSLAMDGVAALATAG
jgi:hypothetical protein